MTPPVMPVTLPPPGRGHLCFHGSANLDPILIKALGDWLSRYLILSFDTARPRRWHAPLWSPSHGLCHACRRPVRWAYRHFPFYHPSATVSDLPCCNSLIALRARPTGTPRIGAPTRDGADPAALRRMQQKNCVTQKPPVITRSKGRTLAHYHTE